MNTALLTIEEVQQGLLAKEFSATELVERALREAEKQEPNLHAFLTLPRIPQHRFLPLRM